MVYVEIYLKVLLISVCLEVNVYVIYSIWDEIVCACMYFFWAPEGKTWREGLAITLGSSLTTRQMHAVDESHGLLFTRIRRRCALCKYLLCRFCISVLQTVHTHTHTLSLDNLTLLWRSPAIPQRREKIKKKKGYIPCLRYCLSSWNFVNNRTWNSSTRTQQTHTNIYERIQTTTQVVNLLCKFHMYRLF